MRLLHLLRFLHVRRHIVGGDLEPEEAPGAWVTLVEELDPGEPGARRRGHVLGVEEGHGQLRHVLFPGRRAEANERVRLRVDLVYRRESGRVVGFVQLEFSPWVLRHDGGVIVADPVALEGLELARRVVHWRHLNLSKANRMSVIGSQINLAIQKNAT